MKGAERAARGPRAVCDAVAQIVNERPGPFTRTNRPDPDAVQRRSFCTAAQHSGGILASPTPGGCASTWRTWRATSVLSRVRGTKPGRPWLAHRSAFTVVASTLARVCLFHFRACVGSCGGAAWRTLLPKARAKSYKVSVGVVDAELAADGCAHLCGGLTIER